MDSVSSAWPAACKPARAAELFPPKSIKDVIVLMNLNDNMSLVVLIQIASTCDM